jgi:hypothetical protein
MGELRRRIGRIQTLIAGNDVVGSNALHGMRHEAREA